jgi:Asp/Glu/hydantoin racemase
MSAPADADRPNIILVNPNTSSQTTEMMVGIAQAQAGSRVQLKGMTAPFGSPFIQDEVGLATAARAVAQMIDTAMRSAPPTAFVVAAFGDPGVAEARAKYEVPVLGIGEESFYAAAKGGRFSVVTSTPALGDVIRARANELNLADRLVSVRFTRGDAATLMTNPKELQRELLSQVNSARLDGAGCAVIGGGPLSAAANAIRGEAAIPVIDPLSAAMARLLGMYAGDLMPHGGVA